MKYWAFSFAFFTLVFGIISCNTNDKNDDTFITPEPFLVSFEIDTIETIYEDGEDFYGNAIGINWYPDSMGILYSQSTSFLRAPVVPNYEDDVLTIEMVKYYSDSVPPTYNEAFQLFSDGTYNYGGWSDVFTNLGVDGVIVTYTDSDGRVWTSDKRAGEQESWATFEISEHTAVENEPYGAETRGTFNCRVYDGVGGQLDLTNGRFYARTMYQQE